jgi:hypothetical protein
MGEKILILLAFPLVWPFVAQRIWHTKINVTEMVINIVLITALSFGVWELGKYEQLSDTEIWNGSVTTKNREHGYYVTTYSCNCRETCSGSGENRSCTQTCDTCYEDHYTVTWTAGTTVGNVTFDKKDSTWRSVYNSPDPSAYKRCIIGEPASIEHDYKNYVQAVPQSLFSTVSTGEFKEKIPKYPRVYDFYHINRVLSADAKVSQDIITEIQRGIDEALKTLGYKKQVNIITILTEIDDPAYRYAVENAWLGGEKNDVVIFVGLNNTEITWTDVMTWALNKGNELFHVRMRDSLKNLKILDPKTFTPTVINVVSKHYDRPEMKQFEYLEEEVEPPIWVVVLAVVIAIGGSIGLSIFFLRNEVEDVIGGMFNRWR